MDCLEGVSYLLSFEILSLIADIIKYKKIANTVGVWRSKVNSGNAYQLILDIWNKETERLEIFESTEGCIISLSHPLTSKKIKAVEKTVNKGSTEKMNKLSQAMVMGKIYEDNDCFNAWNTATNQCDRRIPIIMIFKQLNIVDCDEFKEYYQLKRVQYLHLMLILK